jgi:hypothetical protein
MRYPVAIVWPNPGAPLPFRVGRRRFVLTSLSGAVPTVGGYVETS